MRAWSWEITAISVTIIGSALLGASIALPEVKSSQTYIVLGPNVPYLQSNYTISGYSIPPVDRGTPMLVTLYAYKPNSILLTVVPLQGDLELEPILATSVATPERYSANLTSSMSAPYRILIISFEKTTFVLMVESVWSEFYPLGTYKAPALLVLLIGIAGTLYFRYRRSLEAIEEKVRNEISERERSSSRPTDTSRTEKA